MNFLKQFKKKRSPKRHDRKSEMAKSIARDDNSDLSSDVMKQRKRLSLLATQNNQRNELLDGIGRPRESSRHASINPLNGFYKECIILSKVGKSPYNPLKVNQDMGIIIENIKINKKSNGNDNNNDKELYSLIGAFDGHGIGGEKVSQYLVSQMCIWYDKCSENTANSSDINEIITKCFSDLTKLLKKKKSIDCTSAGSTAVICMFNNTKYYCGNVGDSRIVLGRYDKNNNKIKSIPLSFDQKPDNKNEKERIEKCNGRVEQFKDQNGNPVGPYRVWLKEQQFPGLAMSRSFGDDIATSVGVTSIPEIIIRTRDIENDKYLIAASDGVWEFISDDEAIDIVSKCDTAEKAAKALVKESTKRWESEESVIDDITAVVAFLS